MTGGMIGENATVFGMEDQPSVSVATGEVVTGAVLQASGSVESEKVVIILPR